MKSPWAGYHLRHGLDKLLVFIISLTVHCKTNFLVNLYWDNKYSDSDSDLFLNWHIYVHDIRMEAAVKKRWSVTVSDLQAWTYNYTGLPAARYAREILSFFFPFAYYGLLGVATCGVSVWNGGLTESTASVHYLHRVLD